LRSVLRRSSFLIILFGVIVQAKDDGFSGKWALDMHNPQADGGPKKLQTVIKQDGSGLTFNNTFQEPENGVVPLLYLGVMATKVHLGSDGQEQQNTIGPFQMASKTTMDGKQIDTDWTAVVQGDQVQGHWTHKLSDDGKHLIWEIKESSTQGQHGEATLYFVRK
jgi:hypothetical protein